ncbi:type VI secretion protein ImpB [bacterium]|nr:type VI secretion protein ImpB [bacterium]
MSAQPVEFERLYLDFDSFFASAEQHFNPALRGRPVGVVPLDSPHTSCIAVSREAKQRGIKTGAKIADAKQVLPDMIFVVARPDAYVRLHNRILEVIETILPIAQVRSIDEVVCHLLPSEARQGRALAQRIKSELAKHFSDGLTCSIGMAPTELLAKVAAEMDKPNGLVLLRTSDLPARLRDLPLRDLPGISVGMEDRLERAGITDFSALWQTAPKQARAIWRSVEGERFWQELHGIHADRQETQKRMFGHSRVLLREWQTPDRVRSCAQQLILSAGRRLRRTEYKATKLTLGFKGARYRDRSAKRKDVQRWNWEADCLPACDDRTFLRLLGKGLDSAERKRGFRPAAVSIILHGLVCEGEMTGDLFGDHVDNQDKSERDTWEKVSNMVDKLRSKHGSKAISLGAHEDVRGGYLGAKIAFGRIPEKEDFSAAPSRDEDTQFCFL